MIETMHQADANPLSQKDIDKKHAHCFSDLWLEVERLENQAMCHRPDKFHFAN